MVLASMPHHLSPGCGLYQFFEATSLSILMIRSSLYRFRFTTSLIPGFYLTQEISH